MRNFILIFISLLICNLSGQVLNGYIRDESGKPVSFVNIGVENKNLGTVSDLNGQFTLKVNNKFINDTLIFSCIGYSTKTISINNLIDNFAADSIIIKLEKTYYPINEVEIKSSNRNFVIIGDKKNKGKYSIGIINNKLGYELGKSFTIKDDCILQKLLISPAYNDFDSVYYRLNIYQKEKGRFKPILSKPIYITLTEDDFSNEIISIDLTDYQIKLTDNALLTFENIVDKGEGSVRFYAGLLKGTTYTRETSHGKWTKIPIDLSFSIQVKEIE